MAHPGQRNQLRDTEMFTDLRSLSETRGGGAKITLKRQADRSGVTQVSPFNAVQVGIIKQPLAPLDPAAATGQLAPCSEAQRPTGSLLGVRHDGSVANPGAY